MLQWHFASMYSSMGIRWYFPSVFSLRWIIRCFSQAVFPTCVVVECFCFRLYLKSSLPRACACSIHLYRRFLSRGFMSFSTQVGLRSIRSTLGDMWSAAAEQSTPQTRSTYTLFGCMIYELCPRVAGFIFLLLTAPSLWGSHPSEMKGKRNQIFWPLNTSKESGCPAFFTLMELGRSVCKFDVSKRTGCCCNAMIIGGNDVMLDLGPHTHRHMGYRGGRCPQRILWIKPRLCKHFCLCSLDLMAHTFVWEMTICSEATL